jgi:hypothetical protein
MRRPALAARTAGAAATRRQRHGTWSGPPTATLARARENRIMREILPGIRHWTVKHPKIGVEVSSYQLVDEGVLLDPLVPAEGLDAFADAPPAHILLTNRHHYRDSGAFAERFGCTIRCIESGMHEFTKGEPVQPFRISDPLPGGLIAHAVGVICPDETAILIPRGDGVLAVADGVVRRGDSPLGFVPDEYLGDDAEAIKRGLRKAYRDLLDLEFDHLLLAHGDPWIGGGKQALREFTQG